MNVKREHIPATPTPSALTRMDRLPAPVIPVTLVTDRHAKVIDELFFISCICNALTMFDMCVLISI